jgi:hypothetical protein
VLLTDATQPNVDMAVDGSCPPSDANSKMDFPCIRGVMSSSSKIIVMFPIRWVVFGADVLYHCVAVVGLLLFSDFHLLGAATVILVLVMCITSVGVAEADGACAGPLVQIR